MTNKRERVVSAQKPRHRVHLHEQVVTTVLGHVKNGRPVGGRVAARADLSEKEMGIIRLILAMPVRFVERVPRLCICLPSVLVWRTSRVSGRGISEAIVPRNPVGAGGVDIVPRLEHMVILNK